MVKSKLKIKSIFMPLLLVVALVLLASATLVLGISTLPKEQYISELTNIDPIATYEKTYCEELMSYKLDKNYICSFTKELYDFSGAANYMLCYDENLNWYAIINRESGDVLERKESTSPYNDYLQSICYYLGYGNYFYLEGDRIISILDETLIFDVNNLPVALVEDSIKLNEKAISEGTFKSRNEIETFVKEQESSVISLCGASNRNKTHYCDNLLYFLGMCDVMVPKCVALSLSNGVVTAGIGCAEFTRYNGAAYDDIIFPINTSGTCGVVSAAMLLQYFERNRIINTVPNSIYNNSNTSFVPSGAWTYMGYSGIENLVAQKVHNEINAYHNEVMGGSTYVSIKDALNDYFSNNGIYGISATSSILDASIKSTINNGDPVVVFIGGDYGYSAYINSSNSYHEEYISSHAMLAFGYTTGLFGIVDEYICNKGWTDSTNSEFTYGVTYISRLGVVGNVRLLY